jgi:hypothetical protein
MVLRNTLPDIALESARNCLVTGKPFDRQKHRSKYVVELLGDYYHSEDVIGFPCEAHEKELVAAYSSVGIECLALWEHDVLGRWNEIEPAVSSWVDRAVSDMNQRPAYRKSTKAKVDRRKGTLVCPHGSGRVFRSQSKLDKWLASPRNYWRPGLVENRDFVVCHICNTRCQKLTEHLRRSHGMSKSDYFEGHPDALLVANVVSDAVPKSCCEKPHRRCAVVLQYTC